MASYSPKLLEKKYNNWVKAQLAVLFTKEGLKTFVCDEIQQFQLKCLDDICSNNGLLPGTLCSKCFTENHVKCPTKSICIIKEGQCNYHRNASLQFISTSPNGICHNFKCKIKKAHRYKCPSYKNTDTSKWCSNSWEVAKCFMPPDGYKDKATETDFNGIISVILNYKGFQGKIDDSLKDDTSVFKAARETVNKLRHSSNLEVEDSYLQELLIILQKLLSDSKYLAQDTHAQQASEHLKQLKIDTLTISNDYLRKAHEQYERVKLDEEKRKQEDLLNGDENDDHDNNDNNNDNNYAPIARAGDETQTAPIPPKFEEELIQWYIKNKLSLQLSMTDDSVDTKFEDLYVKQELSDHRTGKLETSLKDLFTSEGKVSLDIFLCSIVGAGNTTFAKYLTRLWCQSHGQGSDHNDNFQEEDLNALRDIDFVFLLNLTDSSSKCDTEDMIYDQIIQNLPCNSYEDGKSFLKQVLNKKRCLIILDESDRWEHPQKCTKSFQGIPHRYASENIIVVTIARQRKLVNINDSQINKEIEINRLGNKSKKQLQINALKGIAEKKNEIVTEEELKNQQEAFQSEISAYNLDELASVPLILMHLVCLWHDNCFKVLSECQVYGNIIEMILSTTQKNFQYFQTNDFEQLKASGYKELLDGLGNLASHSFKGGKTIARSVVNKFLKEEQAKLCLISGILSESNGKICSEQNNPEIYFTFENIRKHFRQRLQKSE